jgi:hypothetical protein
VCVIDASYTLCGAEVKLRQEVERLMHTLVERFGAPAPMRA